MICKFLSLLSLVSFVNHSGRNVRIDTVISWRSKSVNVRLLSLVFTIQVPIKHCTHNLECIRIQEGKGLICVLVPVLIT